MPTTPGGQEFRWASFFGFFFFTSKLMPISARSSPSVDIFFAAIAWTWRRVTTVAGSPEFWVPVLSDAQMPSFTEQVAGSGRYRLLVDNASKAQLIYEKSRRFGQDPNRAFDSRQNREGRRTQTDTRPAKPQ